MKIMGGSKRVLLRLILILTLFSILFFIYSRQISSIFFYNHKKVIESKICATIPCYAVVLDYSVYNLADSLFWPYTSTEMIEEGIIYIDDNLYENMPNELFIQLWPDGCCQELYMELLIFSHDYQILSGTTEPVGSSTIYNDVKLYDSISFSDHAEMRTTAKDKNTYQIRSYGANRRHFYKLGWGLQKVVLEITFTRWELEKLGIDFISNTE